MSQKRFNFMLYFVAIGGKGRGQCVLGLQVHPELCRRIEVAPQTQDHALIINVKR